MCGRHCQIVSVNDQIRVCSVVILLIKVFLRTTTLNNAVYEM